MNEKQERFGSILKELRLHQNMTQEQLGVLINKTTGTIGQFERGDIYPGYETFMDIVKALNVDANLFFSGNTVDYPDEAKWIANLLFEFKDSERETIKKFLSALVLTMSKF